MVSAAMPGLVVRDGTFVDVDARGADLRGAIFYNCFLEGINFRSTDLSGADFINCRGSKIDLRSANLQGTTFVSTTFTKVTYYEADRALFARVSASQRLAGGGK